MTTTTITRRRLTVDEYQRMGEAGILGEDERVELIDGELVEMSPIGTWHSAVVARLTGWFGGEAAGRMILWIQSSIRLSRYSEPEPDVALLKPRADYYAESHPGPDDVLLLIEVSDTSLDYDLNVKLKWYAVAGITEVWIVDRRHGEVIVFREPEGTAYRQVPRHGPGSALVPLALPDLRIRWEDIFGTV